MKAELDQNPGLKTHISSFCQEFASILIPLKQALHEGLEGLPGKADSDALQWSVAGLTDVFHRLEGLVHKVEEQQAYVIIFGPLKSGKSTLMNAISGSYVSEVTSLPAYPCLVHVKYGEASRFVVTRYTGGKMTHSDNRSLPALIHESHETLADRIREVEARGEDFDPGVHFPEAIRRIDVEVPAKNLKDSLTVLVDTPGLYSRMKFGYSLMAREFRNSAASAVFVVKTDNLFLEQVFDEFNDLLDLFSRIFLVVNIDANKRDLSPDGSYRRSIESECPDEVVRAFESLAMSAPLRKAADEGRLKIYPIDLLSAAVDSLKQPEPVAAVAPAPAPSPVELSSPAPDTAGASTPNESAESEPQPEEPGSPFTRFLSDLTAYLNSSDYLHEFMGDSLHRGRSLATEIHSQCTDEALEEFRRRQTALQQAIEEITERLVALETLDAVDWSKSFEKVRAEHRNAATEFGNRLLEETREAAMQHVVDWFESGDSVVHLQDELLNQLFKDCEERVSAEVKERTRSVVAAPVGGMELSQDLIRAIARVEEVIEPAVRASRDLVHTVKPVVQDFRLRIPPETLRVKKGFLDWLLFRPQAAVCRRIFGAPESMDQLVPSSVKRRRLAQRGHESIAGLIDAHLARILPATPVDASDKLLSWFITALCRDARQRLHAGKNEVLKQKHALERRRDDNRRIEEFFTRLSAHADSTIASIGELRAKFHAVDWETRGQLAEPGEDNDADTAVQPTDPHVPQSAPD
jgi:signal recognition particle receptor subunit beta